MEDFEKKKKKRNFQQLYFHYCSLLFERKGFERRKKKKSVLPISSVFHIRSLFLEIKIAFVQYLEKIHRFNLHIEF